MAQQAYLNATHTLTQEKDKLVVKGNKSNELVVKEYKKRIKNLSKLAKQAGNQVKDDQSALKKLGVDASHCKSLAPGSSSGSDST